MQEQIINKIKEALFHRKQGIYVYYVFIEKIAMANSTKNQRLEELLCQFRTAYHVYSWDTNYFEVGVVDKKASKNGKTKSNDPHTIDEVVKIVGKSGFAVENVKYIGELETTFFGKVTGP